MENNYNISVEVNFENKNATIQMIVDNKDINKFIFENNINNIDDVATISLNITNIVDI